MQSGFPFCGASRIIQITDGIAAHCRDADLALPSGASGVGLFCLRDSGKSLLTEVGGGALEVIAPLLPVAMNGLLLIEYPPVEGESVDLLSKLSRVAGRWSRGAENRWRNQLRTANGARVRWARTSRRNHADHAGGLPWWRIPRIEGKTRIMAPHERSPLQALCASSRKQQYGPR
jgi:hypothetical protein